MDSERSFPARVHRGSSGRQWWRGVRNTRRAALALAGEAPGRGRDLEGWGRRRCGCKPAAQGREPKPQAGSSRAV
eukprot:3687449-Rhodomonas_salina.2